MPYIEKTERAKIDPELEQLCLKLDPHNIGQLAYVIYTLMRLYWTRARSFYQAALILGAMDSARHEFHKHELGPHEKWKRKQNGPVLVACADCPEDDDEFCGMCDGSGVM